MSQQLVRQLTRTNWREWPSVKQSLVHNDKSIFKSKNEWYLATLLDILGITWEYESMTFILPNGEQYTPDFYLPEIGQFIEAKSGKAERLHKPYMLQKMLFDQANPSLADTLKSEVTTESNENGIQMIYPSPYPETWKMLKVYIAWDGQLIYADALTYTDTIPGTLYPEAFWGMCPECDRWYPVCNTDSFNCRYCNVYFGDGFQSTLTIVHPDYLPRWNEVSWRDIACYAHTGPDEITNLKSYERLLNI